MSRLPKQVVHEIEQFGRPWELVDGSKHLQIRIDGKLVCIWPKGSGGGDRKTKNAISYIRARGRALFSR